MLDYESYERMDFAMDPRFQNWVRRTHDEDTAFWEAWITRHPAKMEEVEEAIRLVHVLDSSQDSLSKEEVENQWHKLQPFLVESAQSRESDTRQPLRKRPIRRVGIAAVFALLVASVAGMVWLQSRGTKQWVTEAGEVLNVSLPDKSTIVLGPNSVLRYEDNWAEKEMREVWLEGEAYAEVSKDPTQKPFRVYFNEVQVEVLGTVFNINSRRGKSTVVLHKGKVRLSHEKSGDTLTMEPGDLVAYSEQENRFVLQEVDDPKDYIDWTRQEMLLRETPISEIAQLIEDRYGYQVIIKDESLASERLSGELYTEDLDFLIEALEKSFHLKITRTYNTLIIEKSI